LSHEKLKKKSVVVEGLVGGVGEEDGVSRGRRGLINCGQNEVMSGLV